MPVAVLDDSDERFQLGDSSEGSMAQLNPDIKVGRHVRIAEADLAGFVAAGRIEASA